MEAFITRLLHCVTVTHMLHLNTRSYSEHIALGDFYEGLEDLIDSLAEQYQGKYKLLAFETEEVEPASSALEYMMALSEYVTDTRNNLPMDSELQNTIDEIQSLINGTLYKLRFLK